MTERNAFVDADGATVPVAVVQHDIAWEDRGANLGRLGGLVESAALEGASLVVLPEMFATGFSADTERIAEPPDGPTVGFMLEQSRRLGVWMVGSVCLRAPQGAPGASGRPGGLPSNVAVCTSPSGEVSTYAKRHLFSYAGEHERIAPGSSTLTVDIGGLSTTVFVCYDLRFADDFWNLAERTEAYVVVANWPAARAHHWRSLLVARAIENQAWVVGANRVGSGGGLDYGGDSLVVDPMGRIVADGGDASEQVLHATLSAGHVADVRRHYPFLRDRL
ncbi:MAG: carbon-nitrogen family hydrolase [Microthrixaceae bacterium]|nr:carbon-nitrogen family hydrolase [Microthrixaceae bacterium]